MHLFSLPFLHLVSYTVFPYLLYPSPQSISNFMHKVDKLAARERSDKTDSAESLNQTISSGSEDRDSGRVHQVILSRRRSTSATDETKKSIDGSGESTGKESSGALPISPILSPLPILEFFGVLHSSDSLYFVSFLANLY